MMTSYSSPSESGKISAEIICAPAPDALSYRVPESVLNKVKHIASAHQRLITRAEEALTLGDFTAFWLYSRACNKLRSTLDALLASLPVSQTANVDAASSTNQQERPTNS